MDLSKIKVRGEESQRCTERYKRAKIVHTIIQRAAINADIALMKVYKELVWPINKSSPKDSSENKALEMFKQIGQSTTPEAFFKGTPLTPEFVKELIRQIKAKLSPHALRIKADFEVTCFAPQGIDAIKAALLAGIKAGTEESAPGATEKYEVKIYLIAPPQYECVIQTKDKVKGIELINNALKKVDEVIKANDGNFLKKCEPRVQGEKEETEKIEEEHDVASSDEEDEEGMDVDLPGGTLSLDILILNRHD